MPITDQDLIVDLRFKIDGLVKSPIFNFYGIVNLDFDRVETIISDISN